MMIPNDEYMQHREELADKCRAMLGDYLRQRGDFKSGNYIKPLFPDRHKHGSTTSDCRYYPETQTVFDHGLKEKYDIFDYIREDYGLTGFYEQINKACELFNIDITPTAQIAPTTPKAPKQTTKTDEKKKKKGGVTMNLSWDIRRTGGTPYLRGTIPYYRRNGQNSTFINILFLIRENPILSRK